MAIQPTIKLAGSEHILRFQGNLSEQAAPGVQTQNAEVPQGAVADTRVLVKFALADMTNLADLQRRLPPGIYDDGQPAAATRPNNTVTGGPSILGLPFGKTWMQNVRVRGHENSASTATPLIARIEELLSVSQLDGPAGSGLGLEQNTGVPVVGVFISFTAAGIGNLVNGIPIVMEFEIPHTVER